MALGTIVFSICLFFSYYELENLSLKYPQFMGINGPLLFTIGPFFFLHIKRKVTWSEVIHFIPFLIVFVWILPFYIKTASEKLEIIKGFYAHSEKPEIEIMQYLYVLHIGLYCLLGYLVLRKRSTLFDSYNSDYTQHQLNSRSQNLYLLISFLAILSFLVCLASDFFGVYYGIVDKFTISLLVVLILLLQVYFTFKGYDENLEIEFENISKTKKNKISYTDAQDTEYKSLMSRLDSLMKTERIFRNPDLKITTVAEKMDVSMHELSAAINKENGNNFFDYINKLRIEELKTTLLDSNKKNLTLFAIARESGFKSNSSFYRVFKKYLGSTPKQYIKRSEK
jgi:AraC-like DNA-binding protein